ncbi:unnamed protein product [Paramecium octaurelia]|uniref:Transmembrane protein n=1 Tax=Paramecium octaurelia TaxID=43137 RepID=A0A8S1W1H5_PAROT|nr:unnamed protein product [Paramecium octaurelia]CAD8180030.1 unnamed protein product [Paramecium octaurelia]
MGQNVENFKLREQRERAEDTENEKTLLLEDLQQSLQRQIKQRSCLANYKRLIGGFGLICQNRSKNLWKFRYSCRWSGLIEAQSNRKLMKQTVKWVKPIYRFVQSIKQYSPPIKIKRSPIKIQITKQVLFRYHTLSIFLGIIGVIVNMFYSKK